MLRVPFVTDEVKEQYLVKKATDKICDGCSFVGHCEFGGVQKNGDVKRTVVKNVQDLFELTFDCKYYSKGSVKISKFFLPNGLFEKKYLEEMAKLSESSMIVDGNEVLDEILKWGRLQINFQK